MEALERLAKVRRGFKRNMEDKLPVGNGHADRQTESFLLSAHGKPRYSRMCRYQSFANAEANPTTAAPNRWLSTPRLQCRAFSRFRYHTVSRSASGRTLTICCSFPLVRSRVELPGPSNRLPSTRRRICSCWLIRGGGVPYTWER